MSAPKKKPLEPGSARELLAIALPLAISSGSLSLMHVVDRIFLTWYSTDALAAGLPAGLLNWTVMSAALGVASYTNAFVAQYEGAGRPDRVAAAIWQGVYFSLAASVLMLALVPLAPAIFAAFGHPAAVQRLEVEYFSILCLGASPVVLSATLACFFSGRGQTQVIMWVNIASALTNAVLDYVLVFGHLGLPAMGIRGAAIGTVVANVVAALAYAAIMVRGKAGRDYRLWPAHGFDGELFGRLLRFGGPEGVYWFMEVVCFTLFIQIVGRMGTEQLAATSLTFNLNTLAFVPMLGFGTAVMTLVGRRVGEGRPELAVRTTWLAYRMASCYTAMFAAIYLWAPGVILLPYAWGANAAEFAVLESHVATLLKFVAVYSLFDAMTIIFSSATRGAGDTRFALVYSTVCGLLVMVLPTALAEQYWHSGLKVAWIAVTAYIIAMGSGFLIRFLLGPWKSMRVIEHRGADGEVAAEPVTV